MFHLDAQASFEDEKSSSSLSWLCQVKEPRIFATFASASSTSPTTRGDQSSVNDAATF
jgi:hypothetical protein